MGNKFDIESMKEKICRLFEQKQKVIMGGGTKRINNQHKKGKKTARERIDLLVDNNSFQEHFMFMQTRRGRLEEEEIPGEGSVTGYGTVEGKAVCLYSQDFTVMGGSAGEVHCEKIARILQYAIDAGVPYIGINDGAGARIQEGMGNLYERTFYLNTIASGVIPQISLIMGPCAGGSSYSPALTDFIFMVKGTSYMFITGPMVIEAVIGEKVDMQQLGGGEIHNSTSGVAHFLAEDEEECISLVKRLLSFLPSNNQEEPPYIKPNDDPARKNPRLREIIPVNPSKAYDIRRIIEEIVDNNDFFEVQSHFAQNIVISFARLNGHVIGIVANQPCILAGCLDINASCKAARFVRFCDAFSIPIITLVDVPGYLPGLGQEHGGIIRHGAKLLYAFAEATVPKITIVLRKDYGGGFSAMCSKNLGADMVYALPTAEIAIMGPEGAVNVLFRERINKSSNPGEERQKLINEYREKYCTPTRAAEVGLINDVIDPAEVRSYLIDSLTLLKNKKKNIPLKKHGNIPL